MHILDDLALQLLLTSTATTWQSISETRPVGAANFHIDTNAPPSRAFYRSFELT